MNENYLNVMVNRPIFIILSVKKIIKV